LSIFGDLKVKQALLKERVKEKNEKLSKASEFKRLSEI